MSKPVPVNDFIFVDHAFFELERRGISEADVEKVLANPEQVETIRTGRAVYQSRFKLGDPPKIFLLRVFVDIDRHPPEVVTAYRTSKVEKYWR
jgi:hypothetical protein